MPKYKKDRPTSRRTKRYVAYYRVSTKEQGQSGLGLDDQKHKVESTVGKEKIIAEFTEIESGRKKNREQLDNAIAYCEQNNCTLAVAKLDRLGRNAQQLFAIRERLIETGKSGLLVIDKPHMGTIQFGIFATLAQDEAERISARTKAALAAKKRQGFKLGKPENLTIEARKKGAQARANKARNERRNLMALGIIKGLKKQGASYRAIAKELNNCGLATVRGKNFSAMTVHRIYKMYAEK